MKKVVIKRSEWLRGEYSELSALFRESDGKRCCLGFVANQLIGLSDEEIDGVSAFDGAAADVYKGKYSDVKRRAENVRYRAREMLSAIFTMRDRQGRPLATQIVHINDDARIVDSEREEKIIEMFKKIDIAIEFVD